jgi:hypothetical protein
MPEPERKEHVRCLMTERWIRREDPARWSEELNGFVSEKGQRDIDSIEKSGTMGSNPKARIIWSEWWHQENQQKGFLD